MSDFCKDKKSLPVEIEHMMIDGQTPLKDCASVSQALFGSFIEHDAGAEFQGKK